MKIQTDRTKKIFYHSNLLFSIRIIIALLGTTLIPAFLGEIHATIPLTLGVIAAAIADIDASPKQRIVNLSLLLTCFAIAAFSVELLFPYPGLFLIGLILSGFFFTIIGALGQKFSVISLGTLLMATYTMLGVGLFKDQYVLSCLLILGALWYGLIAWIESIVQPIRTTHEYLNHSFKTLGKFLQAKSHMFDPDETDDFKIQTSELTTINQALIKSMNESKRSLFNRLRGDQGHKRVRIMLNYYFVAQDIHERATSSHISYQKLSHQLKNSDILFRISRILSLQGKACAQIADSIKYHQPYHHNHLFEKYFKLLDESIQNADISISLRLTLQNILKNLTEIDKQFRQINQVNYISQDSTNNNIVEDEVSSFKDAYDRIKKHLTLKSALFRHSVRISLVFAIGYIIILLTHLPHGYWILMTALVICQPNYSTTQKRVLIRFAGTISGIFLGVFFVYLFNTLPTQIFAIITSAWLYFIFKNSRQASATVFITLLVFFSFSLTGESSWDVAWSRIIATIIGSVGALLAVFLLWPDWKYRTLPSLVETANHDNANYLKQTHRQYQESRIDNVDYRYARREAHENSADLSELISIMSNEPKVDHDLIDQAFRFLTLNHTFISYIATLGVHRASKLSPDIQIMFNNIEHFIHDALHLHTIDDVKNHEYCNALQEILDTFNDHDYTNIDYQVISQLQLMLQILPEIIETSNKIILKH
ncbi:YccS family putative transporter [Wohlfahrtiimonas larvae]|uniref:YccS family putative transporter n=1 Tax=Wohlfahrtiimonas larvae TaxID=1157986 RepID=A0ABP9MJG9_9GAMM|nr:YccS family putative transporter [Wohlfahrtiimonas larvae]